MNFTTFPKAIFVTAYFTKIKGMVDLLDSFGATILDKNLVIYAINFLSSKFDYYTSITSHQLPLPNFL